MVRCIGADGAMIGIIPTSQARQMAERLGLDLVEISPNVNPPVCKIMDYGKYLFEQKRKEKEARRHQASQVLKEIKFHVNVADHDFQTKINHMKEFFERGFKVKASLFFRGRENAHKELGMELMDRVVKACEEAAVVEQLPKLMGNQIVMILGAKPRR